LIMPGRNFGYKFTDEGTYDYFCIIHPWATGVVIVQYSEGSVVDGKFVPTTSTPTTTTSSKIPTILVLDPLPSRVDPEESLTISGTLKTPEGFTPHGVTIYIHGKMTYRGDTFEPTPATLKTDVNGKFFFKNNFDLPPEIDEKLTIDFYAVYKGGKNFEPSKSQTYRVLFTPTTTTSTTTTTTSTTTSTLPPGVKSPAPNFESDIEWRSLSFKTIIQLYEGLGNPQKNYAFTWGNYDIKNAKIVRGDGKDLLVIILNFKNNENNPIDFPQSISMYDGKDRKFYRVASSGTNALGLEIEVTDFDWREDCPVRSFVNIQPGLTGKLKICYEMPKDADHFKLLEYYDDMVAVLDRAYLGSASATGSAGGGCLIATAAFGSEMAPQVQFLRELRDNTVLQTESGTSFMTGFNQFYYSFSPAVADYERENPVFKEAVKLTLTPLLTSLTLLQYTDIDSESEMLGYGIGVILLNIGMYFVAPAVLIMKIRKRI